MFGYGHFERKLQPLHPINSQKYLATDLGFHFHTEKKHPGFEKQAGSIIHLKFTGYFAYHIEYSAYESFAIPTRNDDILPPG